MTVDKKYSPRCFIDIEIDGENAGRIIMELFTDVCPITCENFRALCTGEKGIGKTTDKPLHYKGAPFHRVVKNFVIQGGDFVAGNGTGGESIYGGQFKDENFDIPHDKPFLLSMSNRGKDSNGSQFFITTQAAPHLNGKHTVFGQVIHGQEVVTKIENIKTDQSCRPTKDVKISNCGELVLKIHQKEKKRHVSTESSDSESEEERAKRRRHKHSKKHKKDKKETRESNPSRKEEDSGCMVDPEEIPTIPTNNFLMRRTSPIGDRNRRPPQRESYSYGRPVVSRSGRKIKGRGFMRYRTPSRSTSRSGSETPPHWKQAQSRLRNIKDVVLPKKPVAPPVESDPEDMEDARGNVLHSRLGMVSKAAEDQKQKDARLLMRENRRNREWSSEESPPRNAARGATGGSPLRSTVVVTSNFQKEPDRFHRTDWRSGNRRGRSPERRPFDRFNDNDSNRNRRQVAADSHKKPDRPQRSEKDIEKSFRALAQDFTRYHKEIESDESTDREKDHGNKSKEQVVKNKDQEVKTKVSEPKKVTKARSQRLKSLKNELFRYHKSCESSSESSAEESKKESVKDSETAGANIPKETPSKGLKSLESELAKYRKDKSDYSSDDSSNEKDTSKKKASTVIPFISDENTITRNGNDEENAERAKLPKGISGFGMDPSMVRIPGICDSNEASMDTDNQPQSAVTDMEFQTASEQMIEQHKMPGQLIASNEVNTEKTLPVVKEKRRWDMQEAETKKKVPESIQIVFHTVTMPEIIPLPDETRSVKTEPMDVSEPQGMLSVAHASRSKTPPMDYGRSRSRSPNEKVFDSSPMKSSKHIREHDGSVSPDPKHSSITTRTTSKEPRSPSPKIPSSSKHIPRSPSNSPPARRKSSTSPEPRTKKLRSKSPIARRTRPSKSPPSRSKSPIPRRSRQSKSPRRARPSVSRSRSRDRIRRRRSRSPLNIRSRRSISRDRGSRFRRYGNRSPDRRGGYRYGKSPSFRGRLGGRGRRTRSRSPIRRRRTRRSSSSSGSSSSRSSSSRSDRRKKITKSKRRSSSSSSSSRSKKSDSDSAST